MIKNLFTKRERRSFRGITKEQAMQAAAWFWRSRQFAVDFTSPYSVRGQQFYSKLGLRQWTDVHAMDEGKDVAVDVGFSAELTDEGAVLGAVGAVLILPVTVVVGAVSYVEYENDAQRLMNDFWTYLSGFAKNPQPPPPVTVPSWAQGPPQQPGRACPSCKGAVDADAKFCKHCGNKL